MERNEGVRGMERYEWESSREPIAGECSLEHTLPDYMPEVRKILGVEARPIATGRYREEDRAEFSGILAYTVLYLDEEGKPAAVSLNGEYTVSVPCRGEADSMGCVDTEVENTVCRVTAPRKLSLRSALLHRVHLAMRAPLPSPDAEGCQYLRRKCLFRESATYESGEVAFSDGVAVSGTAPDSLRLLFCEGGYLSEEVRPTEGEVTSRGTVHVRILALGEEGQPMSFTARIPLSCRISAEQARAGDGCLVEGQITSVNVRATGDGDGGCRLEIDGTAECRVRLFRNAEAAVTVGAYSPVCRTELHRTPLSAEAVVGTASGHYTVSGNFPLAGEERPSLVLDTSATATVRKIAEDGERPVVLGDVKVKLLCAGTPDEEGRIPVFMTEGTHPFRLQAPISLPAGRNVRYECHVSAPWSRGRLEEGGYATDTELSMNLVAFAEESMSVIEKVTLHPEEAYDARSSGITVVYVSEGDTLWSLAERYHLTPEELALGNRLPFSGNEDAALGTSLDGVAFLLVE